MFTRDFLAGRHQHLEQKRKKVLGDIDGLEQRISLGIARHDEAILLQRKYTIIERIDAAVDRLNCGTYGTCLSCQRAIPITRLERMPDAPTCVPCSTGSQR